MQLKFFRIHNDDLVVVVDVLIKELRAIEYDECQVSLIFNEIMVGGLYTDSIDRVVIEFDSPEKADLFRQALLGFLTNDAVTFDVYAIASCIGTMESLESAYVAEAIQ